MSRPAIVALSADGLALGRRLAAVLEDAELHGLSARTAGADVTFANTGEHIRALFAARRPVVGICAAGILVRSVAELLGDKRSEPALVAIAEDGSAVVPLLGGHHGANVLARRIAEALGVAAAVTTASDAALGVALDEPPSGFTIANPQDAKRFAARLLAGEAVRIEGDAGWLENARLRRDGAAALCIRVSHEAVPGDGQTLVYHPWRLALGVGCERGCEPEELEDLVRDTLAAAGLAPGAVALVATLDLKADEPAVLALSGRLGVPARFFAADALEAETPRLANPSQIVFREVGCHGVAEAAALAAAGPDPALVVPKRKSRRATCAVAIAPDPIDAAAVGRARGRLSVVGLGPGAAEWRTPEADRLLAEAQDLVGYGFYLDLAGPVGAGKKRHDFALGEEGARARRALTLAAEGRDVALVSSGDPGIFAMAALVFELVEGNCDPAWRRVEIVVAPGISALQAAAARVGAPLGHDFCAISLSDLLTPREVILKRLAAAAEGDFVVALYNPASRRRRALLAQARDVFLTARPAATPVVVARQLGRDDECVTVTDLGAFDPQSVDMMTLVMVGAASTRAFERGDGEKWVYTPRGYGLGAGRTGAVE